VDLSGIIFVVLALAWAVYLVPKALKHHDEVARTRSVERFSTAMRVLARREPVDRRNARLVVTPARTSQRVLLPSRATDSDAEEPETARRVHPGGRAAARAAARRRRHVTLALVLVGLVVVALAAFSILPWWGISVPSALTLLYLGLCRRQVKRENDALWSPAVVAERISETAPVASPVAPRRAIRVEAPYGTVQAPREAEQEFSPDEDTVQIPMTELETVAVSVETVDGGSLWDPLPVTLPTYVNKARAERSVRTIDLSAPGTWTSGRDEADSALVEQMAEEAVETEAEAEERRAVGS
jgi:hypothetical protein